MLQYVVSVESSFLIHHMSYSLAYFLYWFIDGLEKLHANQMFRITAEAKGVGFNPVKHALSAPVIYYLPFQSGTSVVVPQCYMLLLSCVYGFQQYAPLTNSFFVLQFK